MVRVYAQVKLDPKTGDFAGGMYTIGRACRTIELARISPGLSSIGDSDAPRGIISYEQGNFRDTIVIEERLSK